MITKEIAECLESLDCINGGTVKKKFDYLWLNNDLPICLNSYWIKDTLEIFVLKGDKFVDITDTLRIKDDMIDVVKIKTYNIVEIRYDYVKLDQWNY